ncbi:hypothetical protein EYF80_053354 [Liparis tanakae]|uniref:Uncharacterized protein n=1 Tax=Liparis tanakae TaxID=230148 RepID=A0A4Z2F6J5_9TELE|nr:hypothetical protein EYF80_053354 [Liparis tanakae]
MHRHLLHQPPHVPPSAKLLLPPAWSSRSLQGWLQEHRLLLLPPPPPRPHSSPMVVSVRTPPPLASSTPSSPPSGPSVPSRLGDVIPPERRPGDL